MILKVEVGWGGIWFDMILVLLVVFELEFFVRICSKGFVFDFDNIFE